MEKPCLNAISARFVEDDGADSRENRHPRVRMQEEGDVWLFEKRCTGVPEVYTPYPANADFPPLPLRRSWLSVKDLFEGKKRQPPIHNSVVLEYPRGLRWGRVQKTRQSRESLGVL